MRESARREWPRCLVRGLAAFAAAALLAGANAAGAAPALLVDAPDAAFTKGHGRDGALDALRAAPSTLGVRLGRSNVAAVVRSRAFEVVLPDTGETLTIDALEVAALEGGGFALTTPAHQRDPEVSLVSSGAHLHGTIEHAGRLYVVTPLGDGRIALHRQDPRRIAVKNRTRPDFVVPWPKRRDGARRPRAPAPRSGDAPERIDTLVVYTARAQALAGDIGTRIAFLVLETNRMFERSGAATRLAVVHRHRTDYREAPDHYDDLEALADPGDGRMDEVHALRDTHAADIVVLIVGNEGPHHCGGGIAYLYLAEHWSSDYAFAVSAIGSAPCARIDASTFAHEVGHLYGAEHNPEELAPDYEPRFPYAKGRCHPQGGWRTTMAYNTGNRCSEDARLFASPEVHFRGTPTGNATEHDVARLLDESAWALAHYRARRRTHTERLPLLPSADATGWTGFVRVWNRATRPLDIAIEAIDDTGAAGTPLTLAVPAGHMRGFNSRHLEQGSDAAWLTGAAGDGKGHWRLVLSADGAFEARAYVRTAEGLVAGMHERAADESRLYRVPFFNPASNTSIRSLLRITNPGNEQVEVRIEGWDSHAQPGDAPVTLTLSARASVTLSAQALEQGSAAFSGRLGDGAGKWRLEVSGAHLEPLDVMSLLATRSGHMLNVSR